MKTRNRGIAMAMVAIITIALISCSDGGGSSPPPPPPPPDTTPPTISSVSATPASLTLPGATSVTLGCSATSANGSAAKSVVWSVEQKPAGSSVAISGNTASGLDVAGVYKFNVTVTGSNDVTKTGEVTVKANLDANVSFVTLGTFPGAPTLNFSPSAALPKGVTYTITNDKTSKMWDNTGTVSATDFVSVNNDVIFTQTFKLNGTGVGTRTVKVTAGTFMGETDFSFISDTGSVTLKYNP